MDEKVVNKWWQKAQEKHQARTSHHPKAPQKNRWVVPTADESLMPFDGRKQTVKP